MDNRLPYHRQIAAESGFSAENVNFLQEYKSSDKLTLNATVFDSSSHVGIVIVPGWRSPREIYYKLASDLNTEHKVMVYDQRSHSYSEGNFNLDLMAHDLIAVLDQFTEQEKVRSVFIVGHSLGGYISTIASSMMVNEKIAGQILVSVPLSLKSAIGKIPSRVKPFHIFLLNLINAKDPKYRSRMVREYVSFWYPEFRKKPMYFAQRADHPDDMIRQLLASIHLSEVAGRIRINSLFLWGEKDEKLGFNGNASNPDYEGFIREYIVNNNKLSYDILTGISHYMNIDGKRTPYWAGDNVLIKDRILSFVNQKQPCCEHTK